MDGSTGLYFYESRYYDALLGRFISADTIVPSSTDPQALNRYSYGRNNPIIFNDPSGHSWLSNIFNSIKKKLGPVGFVVAAVTLQEFEPLLGTAFLTQSKGGGSVLAGEIIVGTAVATYYCGGCGAATFLQGALVGSTTVWFVDIVLLKTGVFK